MPYFPIKLYSQFSIRSYRLDRLRSDRENDPSSSSARLDTATPTLHSDCTSHSVRIAI